MLLMVTVSAVGQTASSPNKTVTRRQAVNLAGSPESLIDPDAYRVYSAAIRAIDQVDRKKRKEYLIESETIPTRDDVSGCFSEMYESQFSEVYETYPVANRERRKLLSRFGLPSPVRLVDPNQLEKYKVEMNDSGGPIFDWQKFWKDYSVAGGWFRVSVPAFNSKRDKAVVDVRQGCGINCAEWDILLLRKNKSGKWFVVAQGCGGGA